MGVSYHSLILNMYVHFFYFIFVEERKTKKKEEDLLEKNSVSKISWKNVCENKPTMHHEDSETVDPKDPSVKTKMKELSESEKSKLVQTDTSFIMDHLKNFENIKIKYYEQRSKYTNDKEGSIKRVVEIFSDYGNVFKIFQYFLIINT